VQFGLRMWTEAIEKDGDAFCGNEVQMRSVVIVFV